MTSIPVGDENGFPCIHDPEFAVGTFVTVVKPFHIIGHGAFTTGTLGTVMEVYEARGQPDCHPAYLVRFFGGARLTSINGIEPTERDVDVVCNQSSLRMFGWMQP